MRLPASLARIVTRLFPRAPLVEPRGLGAVLVLASVIGNLEWEGWDEMGPYLVLIDALQFF